MARWKPENQTGCVSPSDGASCSESLCGDNVDSDLMDQAKKCAKDNEIRDLGYAFAGFLESQGIDWHRGKHDYLIKLVHREEESNLVAS